jgi:hypothetical protein
MSKGKMVSIVAGFMFLAGIGFAAQAQPPLAGSCPNEQGPWAQVKVAHATNKQMARDADVNDDNVVCEKLEGKLRYEDNEID